MTRETFGTCESCGVKITTAYKSVKDGLCSGCYATSDERKNELERQKIIARAKNAVRRQPAATVDVGDEWTHVVFPGESLSVCPHYVSFEHTVSENEMTDEHGDLNGELIRQCHPEVEVQKMYADRYGSRFHRPINYPAALTDGYGYAKFESEAELLQSLGPTGVLRTFA